MLKSNVIHVINCYKVALKLKKVELSQIYIARQKMGISTFILNLTTLKYTTKPLIFNH